MIPGYRIERSLEPPHPHCTISDPPWFAMGLVEGEALETRLARGERFAPPTARMILVQLAAALAAANAAGFADTHRSPST